MKTLLIIDIQNDFLTGGALEVKDGDSIIPVVNELMPIYDHVVATQDYHPTDHGSFASNHPEKNVGDFIKLNGLSQILWGFYDNGRLQDTGLTKYLKKLDTNELHIVGLATDYCVKFSALDAVKDGFKTTLITDAVRGVNIQANDSKLAINEMTNAGVEIVTSRKLLGETVTLYRPTGPDELALVEKSGWRKWPPRLPEQPIFYPVLNQTYAEQIASEWNIPASGCGYVTQFEVKRDFLRKYKREIVGGKIHEELWIPAEELDMLNENIVGLIKVIKSYEP